MCDTRIKVASSRRRLFGILIFFAAFLTGCGGGSGGTQSQPITEAPAKLILYAGSLDTLGNVDGSATEARFGFLSDAVFDSAGNLFVTDLGNQTIRKITPDGKVSTYAGRAGIQGWADGVGTQATFYLPSSITVDNSGNLYVCNIGDTSPRPFPIQDDPTVELSRSLRKITPAQEVTTVIGGQGGNIAIDKQGNIYLSVGRAIKKITPTGTESILAGSLSTQGTADGIGAQARFFAAGDMTVDDNGNLYVLDSSSVRKVTHDGVVTTLAGKTNSSGAVDALGTPVRFGTLSGIALDKAGNVYVADTDNYVVQKITPAGVVTTVVGKFGERATVLGDLPARLSEVRNVAVDSTGSLYVLTETAILKVQQ